MRLFHNVSLRRKQTLIIMLASSVVLLIACAAFTIYDVITFRKGMVRHLSTLGEILASNTSAALDFDQPLPAEETLSALRAELGIVGACVYRKTGEVFAKYDRADDDIAFVPPAPQTRRHIVERHRLMLFSPIAFKGEEIGVLYLESDMEVLTARLWNYAGIVGLVFLAALLVAFVLSSRLQRLVSDPILHLAQVARSVGLEKNYSVRAVKQSNDELGELVDGFNEMLMQIQARDISMQAVRHSLEERVRERTLELEKIHMQLMEASRRGGMAEVATNVLHNVGNVLNSVNVSAGLIVERLRKSKASSLAKVVLLLGEHAPDLGAFLANDSKGKHVPAYLAQLSEHMIADQEAIIVELDSLVANVEHIKEIVSMQQNYASASGVKEMIDVVDLVEDSLRMNKGGLTRHGVDVVREFKRVPAMNLEKNKILQILVNLVRNAKYACDESGRTDKRMTVRVSNGNGPVKISVIDNGVGIPPENLTRIFNHGFTTRKKGHGFGLHSGALAAKEMGGSLTVQSDGPNRGATFTLELPRKPPSRESPDSEVSSAG